MFDHLIRFFTDGSPQSRGDRPDQLKMAVAVLLVEAATMRDHFGEAERQAIEQILCRAYDLPSERAARLLIAAQDVDNKSTQLFPFTRRIVEEMAEQKRIEVIEMLWETVYSDGVLTPDEDALIRQVASLIYVSDRDRGDARLRVLRKLGINQFL